MNRIPKIALIGRPNVGKSALFNRICQKKIAIVDAEEGVTRDRLYARAELFGMPFTIVDTGGISPQLKIPFQEEVERQSRLAMEEADGLIFVVDGQVGPTPLDRELAKMLLVQGKPLILAINKVDRPSGEESLSCFQCLGLKQLMAVSALQGYQIEELLAELLKPLWSDFVLDAPAPPRMRIALLGRPNVGKSSLFNRLIGETRSIVSPVAGTTRDAIDSLVIRDDKEYLFIDTAGLRKKKSEKTAVEHFASMRTQSALERADICLVVLDVREGLMVQEKKILTETEKQGKSCVLLLNKWDLVKGCRMEHALRDLKEEMPFLADCPILFVSAETGRNIDRILPLIEEIYQERCQRITTGSLNQFIEGCIQKYHPPMLNGKRLRIYYMTQVEIAPPKFAVFVNRKELMVDSYKKYLINQFRAMYRFRGTPLRFELRG